jgi:hypothetical protein
MTKIGRARGVSKTPGSGRKKGTPNKSTLTKEDLNKVRTPEERHGEIMNKMWELAAFKGSTTAAKVWLEDYNNKLTCKLKMQMESIEEIDEAAKFILQQVLEGLVPISVGKRLLDMLYVRKGLREAVLEPMAEEILEAEVERLKLAKNNSRTFNSR